MQRNKEKQTATKGFRFYTDDIEHFDWLCKINDCTHAEMLTNLIRVYAQNNDKSVHKQS